MHETPASWSWPGVAGTVASDQARPFQVSTSGTSRVRPWCQPTPTHHVAVGHDTASSSFQYPPMVGVRWIDHVAPFQRSTSACSPA